MAASLTKPERFHDLNSFSHNREPRKEVRLLKEKPGPAKPQNPSQQKAQETQASTRPLTPRSLHLYLECFGLMCCELPHRQLLGIYNHLGTKPTGCVCRTGSRRAEMEREDTLSHTVPWTQVLNWLEHECGLITTVHFPLFWDYNVTSGCLIPRLLHTFLTVVGHTYNPFLPYIAFCQLVIAMEKVTNMCVLLCVWLCVWL